MKMRRAMLAHATAVTLLAALATAGKSAERSVGSTKDANNGSAQAAALVRQALVAESGGNLERRQDYAKQALSADPDYAPAHWQLGEIRVGDDWLTIDSASHVAQSAGKVNRYRHMRDSTANAIPAQMALARWCESAGLIDQGRIHWTLALEANPSRQQFKEIAPKLGLVRYQNALMPARQAKALKEYRAHLDKALRTWKPVLAPIQRDLASRDHARREHALKNLRELRDPEVVPVLQHLFADAPNEVQQAIMSSVAAMPGQEATDALTYAAVFSPDDDLRGLAAEGLKGRSLFSYVPSLIASLQSSVEVRYEAGYTNGQFRHHLAYFQEGPLANQMQLFANGSTDTVTEAHSQQRGTYRMLFTHTPDLTADRDASRAQQEVELNAVRAEINEKVAKALQTATGNDIDVDPKLWWKWWLDYNEIYQPSEKPTGLQVYDSTPAPSSYRVTYASCFPQGTPVETSTGPLAIEQIHVGDCVLSQDPDSGELAYKVVMATTVRPLSPVVEIKAGGETIRATRGHPFWVSGVGWQMAKELKAGQQLHTPTGSVEIESAQQNGEAECYNLVVADFNSYFVGEHRFLVHDNLLRQVTTATVPGLVDE